MQSAADIQLSMSDKGFSSDSIRENLQRMAKHGFTHLHLSWGWVDDQPLDEEAIAAWKEDLAASNIKVLDVHGPHPTNIDLWHEDPEIRAQADQHIRKRLQLTKELGGDSIVYHVPMHCECTPSVLKHFIDGLARLEDFTRSLGLKIALENHFIQENDRIALSAAFSRFDSDYIGLTLDTGHGIRSGNLDWLLRYCMDRLTLLHLHDNKPGHDRHWIPGTPGGHVDWDAVAKAIASSPYTKPLQFEIWWHQDQQPTHDEFLSTLYDAALEFHHKVEAYRNG